MTRGKKLYGGKKRKKDFTSVKRGTILKADRRYKDTVFRMLYKDKRRLLELYNAVSGRRYDNPDDLEIVTLDSAVYMGMKNDLAFLLDTGIYLYEHQSTVNPNMPLRDLFYIAAEYNTLIDSQSLYSSVMQKIPTPNFIVFYNGEQEFDDRVEYRLSDAFETKVVDPALELKVTVLNINYGRNAALMEQCRTLRDYAAYVKMVRSYKEEIGSLDDAVRQAIDECIKKGILSEFLRRNRAEVELTSIFEYNQEEEERKLRIAERKGGYVEGYEQGRECGIAYGVQRGTAENLYKLVRNFSVRNNVTVEETCKMMGISPEEYFDAERVIKEDNRQP